MQYPFSCLPNTYDCIERTLSPARLARYLPASNGDKHFALRLYIWNMRLCEAMYLPLQTAEVSIRNAVQKPIARRFGDKWYENPKFINLLPPYMKEELKETNRKEFNKYGNNVTKDHIIANLNFGFWVTLMTKAYDKHLWINGVGQSFPNSTASDNRQAIHSMLDKMRDFRNEIMHHHRIFDRRPQAQFQNLIHTTKLICVETHWLMLETSTVSQVINSRPRI